MKTFNVYNPALSAFTILWLTLQRTTQNTWNAEDQIKIKSARTISFVSDSWSETISLKSEQLVIPFVFWSHKAAALMTEKPPWLGPLHLTGETERGGFGHCTTVCLLGIQIT